MSRLPIPGADDGTWGDILNNFLSQEHNADGSLKIRTDGTVSAKADDSTVVHLSGSETIAGVKTFNSSPVVPSPSANTDAANKAYVDTVASSGAPDATTSSKGVVQLAGDLGGTAALPTVPGLSSKEPTITAGTTNQYWRGDKSWQTLDKSAVGLTNVDNTSDTNKPISTATQTALDTKADKSTLTTKGDIYAATAASTPTRLGVGTDGQVLTADATQTTGVKWANSVASVVAGSNITVNNTDPLNPIISASSGSVNRDRRWTPGSAETSIDEFNDSSLDPAWIRVDGANIPAANVDWLEAGDVLSGYHKAADTGNANHGILRPIGTPMVTGDAFITCVTIIGPWATNYQVCSLMLADGTTYGSGKQLSAETYAYATGGAQICAMSDSVGFNAGSSVTDPNRTIIGGHPTYLRIVYLGGTSWRYDFSSNGIQWLLGTAISVTSFTPTYAGLGIRDAGSGTKFTASFEFLRRVSGIV